MKKFTHKPKKPYKLLAVLLVGLSLWSRPPVLLADDPGFAPCPTATPPSGNPPSRVVVVSILSVEPNTDLEGDDDYVPFYDNHADIFGQVTIDGQKFALPEIAESDFPHWNSDGRFEQAVSSSSVSISTSIKEDDWGLTGSNDTVDINPAAGKASLDLTFDLCRLWVFGDGISQGAQGVIESSGGSAGNAAKIRFKVELKDGRPVNADDLALVDLDLVQVVPQVGRLVAGKPTVLLARVANNFSFSMSTQLRVQISGPGIAINDVFPITIGPGEVKKDYLYKDAPLTFPASAIPYNITLLASLDPVGPALPISDCRRTNDNNGNGQTWKIVTPGQMNFLWSKVGTLLDLGNFTPDTYFNEITDLGKAYIKATYPLVNVPSDKSLIPIPPPVNLALDWLVTIGSVFGIPADSLLPFALVFELNGVAAVTGHDRLMGVLPNKDWFERFKYGWWAGKTGVSLGEFAPHAVIFLPRKDKIEGEAPGPAMTLPAHELGHTFGLSVDATLKDSWLCSVDWPIFGSLPCGAAGGFDEYKHEDAAFKKGNPARGFWVKQGGEPASLLPLVDQEQCDSHCFMGNSPQNAHTNWATRKRWIDAADYDQLIDKLSIIPDPEVIYVSGMISQDERIYLGPWYHFPQGIPDRDATEGVYAFRFVDPAGKTIQEVGLPLNWNTPDFKQPLPVTFFGLELPFPKGTRRIQIWNRVSGKLLAERTVSLNVPTVNILSPTPGQVIQQGASLSVGWQGNDVDKDQLTYTILVSPDGKQWWPAAYQLTKLSYPMPTAALKPGAYLLKVLASDGIHVGASQAVRFSVQALR